MAVAFFLLVPVCAVSIIPQVFGNFSRNASLVPFIVLILISPFALFNLICSTAVRLKSFRWIGIYFALSILFSIGTGLYFHSEGVTAYGVGVLEHTWPRLLLPIFIFLVIAVTIFAARLLQRRRLKRTVYASYILTLIYGYFQAILLFSGGGMESFLLFFESGKGDSVPYIYRFFRLNLTTLEPAEAARLLIIFFFPIIYMLSSFAVFVRLIVLSIPLLVLAFSTTAILLALTVVFCLAIRSLGVAKGWAIVSFSSIVFVSLILVLGSEESTYLIQKVISIDASESSRTRYSMIYATILMSLDYPVWGVGWSRDLFFLVDYFPAWGWNWETTGAFNSGEAVSAKSLFFRLIANNGVVLFFMFSFALVEIYRRRKKVPHVGLFIPVFMVGSLIDGGIMTSFYPWVALGLSMYFIEEEEREEKITFVDGR
ncbi:MAG: O-antigen ligase family protein [Cellvibrionaceae bacterium]